jgi:hypothetical protein
LQCWRSTKALGIIDKHCVTEVYLQSFIV